MSEEKKPDPGGSQRLIARLSYFGVLAIALVVAIGEAINLAASGGAPEDFATFAPRGFGLTRLGSLFAGVRALSGKAVIVFGLLLLVGLQIAKVGTSARLFVRGKDRFYLVASAVILAGLIAGLAT